MIQKTNARHASTAVAPVCRVSTDGPEHWGQWSGRRHYSLEVVQHPMRARMCGFGDKDRRPLAPAAVAKMVVKREDNSIIDVEDVDCSFFLVTVDLWSADGKHEMNLVLHPSSSDRYVPAHTAKQRRRGTSITGPLQRSSFPTTPTTQTIPSSSQQYPMRAVGDPQPGMTSMMSPPTTAYTQTYSFSQQPQTIPEALPFQPSPSYVSPPESAPTWGYTQQTPADRNSNFPPVLPSIHSFGRNISPPSGLSSGVGMAATPAGDSWNTEAPVRDVQDFRTWPTEPSYLSDESTAPTDFSNSVVDPSLRGLHHSHPSSQSDIRDSPWSQSSMPPGAADVTAHHSRYNQEQFNAAGPSQYDNTMYTPASYVQHTPQTPYWAGAHTQMSSPPASTIPPLPRHTYTRTLVGPLSANACRLLDEHRKPGIFFLFQDLSVRTEGTFRLRLRLMNVGEPPAPERGACRVHNDASPVLAQAFSEPFIVYSAKRFPGVPDTTALSIAFGNQGQKLPLRNRHGTSKQGRRRQREGDSDDSEDEGSDGA